MKSSGQEVWCCVSGSRDKWRDREQRHGGGTGLPSRSKALSKVWGLSQAMTGWEEGREVTQPRDVRVTECLNLAS